MQIEFSYMRITVKVRSLSGIPNSNYYSYLNFSSEQRPVVLTSKSRFTFSVSVLDLDLKPYESIRHQYKLDGKIVNCYLKRTQAKDDSVMSNLLKENEDCTLVLHKM